MGREGGDNEETRDTVFEEDKGIAFGVETGSRVEKAEAMAFGVIGVPCKGAITGDEGGVEKGD